MKKRTAELILKDPEKFAHHDRVFLNNPVVMQGMGLAPLVVVATTGQNSLALAAAVALLLVPSRVLACLLSRLVPLRDEEPTPEQLQKKLLPRALLYAASAAVVYLAAYPILNFAFGTRSQRRCGVSGGVSHFELCVRHTQPAPLWCIWRRIPF